MACMCCEINGGTHIGNQPPQRRKVNVIADGAIRFIHDVLRTFDRNIVEVIKQLTTRICNLEHRHDQRDSFHGTLPY